MYVLGNPVRYNDPSGHEEESATETDNDSSDDSGIDGTDSSLGETTDDSMAYGVSYSNETPVGSNLNDFDSDGSLYEAGTSHVDFAGLASSIRGYVSGKKPNGRERGGIIDSSEADSISHDRGSDHSGNVNIGDKVSSNRKGLLERIGESMHGWAKDARQPLQDFGEYLSRNRRAGLAACFGAAAFGVSFAFVTEYAVAAKTFEALDLTTGVLNGLIPGSPPPWMNSVPLAVGWALANFREPIGGYISDIWSELKKVRMELDR